MVVVVAVAGGDGAYYFVQGRSVIAGLFFWFRAYLRFTLIDGSGRYSKVSKVGGIVYVNR